MMKSFSLPRAAALVFCVSLCVSAAYGRKPPGLPNGNRGKPFGSLKEKLQNQARDLKFGVHEQVQTELIAAEIHSFVNERKQQLNEYLSDFTFTGDEKEHFIEETLDRIRLDVNNQMGSIMGSLNDVLSSYGTTRGVILKGMNVPDSTAFKDRLREDVHKTVRNAIGSYTDFSSTISDTAREIAKKARQTVADVGVGGGGINKDEIMTAVRRIVYENTGHDI